MYSNKLRQLGDLIGDELLDSSGVLIPKETSFYGQQEKKIEPAKAQPSQLIVKISKLEEKLGIQVEPNAKSRLTMYGQRKRGISYEMGLAEIRKDGYDRFLMFSEIVEIKKLANSGDKISGRLYDSLASDFGDEWLGLIMERRGKDLIFYEEPEGVCLETISSNLSSPTSMKTRLAAKYNCSKISCKDSRTFKVGKNITSGIDIPLSLFGQAVIGYLIGMDVSDYPQNMPGLVICLPPENERVPVGFHILKDKIKINGDAVYRGFRGVKNIK